MDSNKTLEEVIIRIPVKKLNSILIIAFWIIFIVFRFLFDKIFTDILCLAYWGAFLEAFENNFLLPLFIYLSFSIIFLYIFIFRLKMKNWTLLLLILITIIAILSGNLISQKIDFNRHFADDVFKFGSIVYSIIFLFIPGVIAYIFSKSRRIALYLLSLIVLIFFASVIVLRDDYILIVTLIFSILYGLNQVIFSKKIELKRIVTIVVIPLFVFMAIKIVFYNIINYPSRKVCRSLWSEPWDKCCRWFGKNIIITRDSKYLLIHKVYINGLREASRTGDFEKVVDTRIVDLNTFESRFISVETSY